MTSGDQPIYDANNFELKKEQKNNKATLYDLTIPEITSIKLDEENTEITIEFSEPVYSRNDGTGDLKIDNFRLSISGGVVN